ncbi:MAG: PAS domain-containing protein [Polyangiaceae bacterium]
MPSFVSPEAAALRTVNLVSDMLAYWGADERCRFANAAYADWFGRGPDEMRGISLAELLGPLYDQNLPFIRGALAGSVQTFERLIPSPDGRSRHTLATYTPDVVDGEVRGFTAHVVDVSGLHTREEALDRISTLLDRTGALAEVGGAELDLRTGAVFWTKEMCRILDVDPSAIPPPERWTEFFEADALAKYLVVVDEMRANGTPVDFETPMITAKGRRIWVRIRSTAVVEDGQVVKLISAHQDITTRKEAELAQAKIEAQLAEARKLESVGLLAGGVAHDFNNMLSVILAYTGEARAKLDPASALRAELDEVWKAAEKSVALTRQLLAFARRQVVTPVVLDPNEAIAHSLTMLKRLIGANVQVTWRPTDNPWSVYIDRSQLDQVLTNLCVNARDAISGAGAIVIETSNQTIDAAFAAEHPNATPGEFLRLTVSDDGGGIGPDALPRIFEPFFTTKGVGQGTGLGLATVHGILSQCGGFVTAVSEVGRGTTFAAYFPRRAATAQTNDSEPPLARGGSETVLVVEDEPAILRLVVQALERSGYRVLGANGPREARALAESQAAGIQLLVSDVLMPDMNGRELANVLRAANPELKVLFMSGFPAGVSLALPGEPLHFLQKPFTTDALLASVRGALDGNGGTDRVS